MKSFISGAIFINLALMWLPNYTHIFVRGKSATATFKKFQESGCQIDRAGEKVIIEKIHKLFKERFGR